MSFLVFKKCCFCVDLRFGSFLIGYIMLIIRLSTLVITSVRLAHTNGIMHHSVNIMNEDLAFHRLMGIISLMVLVFEILLNLALVVGLHKRLDQHVEMFYVGSFFFLVVGFILFAAMLLRYSRLLGAWAWLFVAIDIVMKTTILERQTILGIVCYHFRPQHHLTSVILAYFLMVVRSYYYRMKEEEKDDTANLDPKENGKAYFERTKPVLYSNKP